MKITKGQIVMTSSGSYSDYSIHDHFRVLRDFDSQEAEKGYRAIPREAQLSFEAWGIREGLWEPTATCPNWSGRGVGPRRSPAGGAVRSLPMS